MRIAAGGSTPIGDVKKYSRKLYSGNMGKHLKRIGELYTKILSFSKRLQNTISDDCYRELLLIQNRIARTACSEGPRYYLHDYSSGCKCTSALANPPPMIKILFPILIVFILNFYGLNAKEDLMPSKTIPSTTQYAGDFEASKNFSLNKLDANYELKGRIDNQQNICLNKVSYSFSVPHYFENENKNIVHLSPNENENSGIYSFVSSSTEPFEFRLAAAGEDAENFKFQKFVFNELQGGLFAIKKSRDTCFYENVSVDYLGVESDKDGDLYKNFKITFSVFPNSSPPVQLGLFDELYLHAQKDNPKLGIELDVVPAKTYRANLWNNEIERFYKVDTLIAQSLHGKVYLREPEDKNTWLFLQLRDISGKFAVYPLEFLLEVKPYIVEQRLKAVGWYLSDTTGRTNNMTDGLWHAASYSISYGPRSPPYNGVLNGFTLDPYFAYHQGESVLTTSYFRFGESNSTSGISYALRLSAQDSINYSLDTSGFYIFQGYYDQYNRWQDTLAGKTNEILDINGFHYTMHNDTVDIRFWDNQKQKPTVTFSWFISPIEKDTTTYDFEIPKIVFTSPSADSAEVPLDKKIVVHFSEKMDNGTLSPENFSLWENNPADGGMHEVEGTIFHSYTSPSATFIPHDSLKGGLNYSVSLNSKITDLAGNKLQDSTWSFRTVDPTGVFDYNIISYELICYPNPASDYFEVLNNSECLKPSGAYQIRMYNALGKCVLSLEINLQDKPRIDVSQLPPGFYYCLLKTGVDVKAGKVVVAK